MSVKRLNNDTETVKEFCSLGNALNAIGSSEMTVMVKTRIDE